MPLIGALLAGLLLVVAGSVEESVRGRTSQATPRDAGGARGYLSGVVADARGPVLGARVTLEDSRRRRLTAVTDPDGRFEFSTLPAETYRLRASTDEHLPAEFGALRPEGPGTPIALAANERLTGLVVTVLRGGSIAGTVRTRDGTPAPNVRIAVSQLGDVPFIGRIVTTDQAGAYRFPGLQAGAYYVAGWQGGIRLPVFYPAVVDPTRALTVDVADGQEREGIDLTLVNGAPTTIAGIARAWNQQPILNLRLDFIGPVWPDAALGTYPVQPPFRPDPDGRFVRTEIRPGRQTIRATARSSSGDELWGAAIIDVPERGIDGVTVELAPPLKVSGQAVFKGTRLKIPDLSKLEIFLDGPGVHGKQGPIFARADGSFEGPAWPGLPTITTVLPDSADPGWYLASAMLHGRDLLDRPPELERATGDLTGVVLTFLDRPTRLAGTVTDTAGIPVTGCTVVVFPADRQLWSSLYRRLRPARPDTKGRFVFDNVPPGNYLMTTVPDLDPRSWRTPAFLETLISTSQRLSLGEGEQKTHDLRR